MSTAGEDTKKVSRGSCEYRLGMTSYKKSKKGSSAYIINSESFHMETMGRHIALPCRSVGKPRPQVSWLDQDGKKILSGKKYQVGRKQWNYMYLNVCALILWRSLWDAPCFFSHCTNILLCKNLLQSQVSSSGSLVIRSLAWKDMGVFTCVAENLVGRDTATTFIYPLSVSQFEKLSQPYTGGMVEMVESWIDLFWRFSFCTHCFRRSQRRAK